MYLENESSGGMFKQIFSKELNLPIIMIQRNIIAIQN